jgi:hypothetical protein
VSPAGGIPVSPAGDIPSSPIGGAGAAKSGAGGAGAAKSGAGGAGAAKSGAGGAKSGAGGAISPPFGLGVFNMNFFFGSDCSPIRGVLCTLPVFLLTSEATIFNLFIACE